MCYLGFKINAGGTFYANVGPLPGCYKPAAYGYTSSRVNDYIEHQNDVDNDYITLIDETISSYLAMEEPHNFEKIKPSVERNILSVYPTVLEPYETPTLKFRFIEDDYLVGIKVFDSQGRIISYHQPGDKAKIGEIDISIGQTSGIYIIHVLTANSTEIFRSILK